MTEEEFIESMDIRQDSYGSWSINSDVDNIKGDVRVVHGNVGVVEGTVSLVAGNLKFTTGRVDYCNPNLGWDKFKMSITTFQVRGLDAWDGIPFHEWRGKALMQNVTVGDPTATGVGAAATEEEFIAKMDIRQDSDGEYSIHGEVGVVYGDIVSIDGDVGAIHGNLDLSMGDVLHVAGSVLNYPIEVVLESSSSIVSGGDSGS